MKLLIPSLLQTVCHRTKGVVSVAQWTQPSTPSQATKNWGWFLPGGKAALEQFPSNWATERHRRLGPNTTGR